MKNKYTLTGKEQTKKEMTYLCPHRKMGSGSMVAKINLCVTIVYYSVATLTLQSNVKGEAKNWGEDHFSRKF